MLPAKLNAGRDNRVVVYAKDQPQYQELPCLRKVNGDVLICWTLSWRERLAILFSGRIFHQVKTCNTPLQPISLSVEKPCGWHINL